MQLRLIDKINNLEKKGKLPVGENQYHKPEADVVERLVIDTKGLVGVLDKLVYGEGGVVGLHHGVRHLGGGHDRVGVHDPVGVLLPDLGDEQCAHAGAGTTTQGVGQLEALQTVAGLGLLPHNIQHRVN